MATPATYSNPAKEAQDLDNEKLQTAYEQGRDADIPSNKGANVSSVDMEKGIQSHAGSTHSDEQTLSDESPTRTAQPPAQEPTDPNVVDWDGPGDPENPQNWTDGRKWGLIAVLAAVTLVTYDSLRPFCKCPLIVLQTPWILILCAWCA